MIPSMSSAAVTTVSPSTSIVLTRASIMLAVGRRG